MKNCIFILLLFISNNIFAQWNLITNISSQNISLNILELSDSNKIFFSGHGNKIYRSINGGLIFDTMSTSFSQNNNYTKIQFTSKDTGYACGGEPFSPYEVVVRTINGGLTWDSVHSSNNWDSFGEMYFINNNKGYFQSTDKPKYTTDGGFNFNYINSLNSYKSVFSYNFITEKFGFAIATGVGFLNGNGSTNVLYTNDYANSWQTIFQDTFNNTGQIILNKIEFKDTLIGYAIGYKYISKPPLNSNYPILGGSLFLSTKNGGINWKVDTLTPADSLNYQDISDMHFVNKDTGYIILKGKVLKTTDGANTWVQQQVQNNDKLSKFKFYNDKIAYAIGANGLYKTTTGGDFPTSITESQLNQNNIKIFPNPFKENLIIQSNELITQAKIFTLIGQELISVNANTNNLIIELKNIPIGEYLLQIKSKKNTLNTKILKE